MAPPPALGASKPADTRPPLRRYIDLWLECKFGHNVDDMALFEQVYIPFKRMLNEEEIKQAAKLFQWHNHLLRERENREDAEEVRRQCELLVIEKRKKEEANYLKGLAASKREAEGEKCQDLRRHWVEGTLN